MTSCRFGLLETGGHLNGNHAMCDFVKHTKGEHLPSSGPATANLVPAASGLHCCRGNNHLWSSRQISSGPALFSGIGFEYRGSM